MENLVKQEDNGTDQMEVSESPSQTEIGSPEKKNVNVTTDDPAKNIEHFLKNELPDLCSVLYDNKVEDGPKANTSMDHKRFAKEELQSSSAKTNERFEPAAACGYTPTIPIGWQQVLANININERRSETAKALRIIADLEPIPPPELTNNIDFKNIYHQIANAMEGKPIMPDPGTFAVLKTCVEETAKRCEGHITPELKAFRHKLNTAATDIEKVRPNDKSTDDAELAIARHFAAQTNYNPLNVTVEYLNLPYTKSTKKGDQ